MRLAPQGDYSQAMLPSIACKSTAEALPKMLARFEMGGAQSLGGFESAVYATPRRVLKLTHTLRRDPGQLEAELHFTHFLAGHGVAVAAPLCSGAGRRVEILPDPDGGAWLAYAFGRLPGEPLRPGMLTPGVSRAWGALTGRMHALTRRYRPGPAPPWRREWHEEHVMNPDSLPKEYTAQRERGHALIARIQTWPRTPETFGLIHSDLHGENLHWDGQTLFVLDFDDCEHHFLMNDLAVSLHTLRHLTPPGTDPDAFHHQFLRDYLRGYRQEAALPPDWTSVMDDLLRLRDLLMLGVLCEAFGIGTPDEQYSDEEDKEAVERYAGRVGKGELICQIDWAQYRTS